MAARFLYLRNEGGPTRWDASRYFKYLERAESALPDDLRDLVSERRLMLSSPESLWHAQITSLLANGGRMEIAGVSAGSRTPFWFRYAGVLKVDGEMGNKKVYDPRSWGKLAETAMASRVAASL